VKTILGSGGAGEDASDAEVIEGIRLLAETEGIFGETAAGVTVAVTRKLIAQGKLNPSLATVLAITGNGLKTAGVVSGELQTLEPISPKMAVFEEQYINLASVHA
jgi:threonine synthase